MGCSCGAEKKRDDEVPSGDVQGVVLEEGASTPKFGSDNSFPPRKYGEWTKELANEIQEAVDRIFGEDETLANVGFSLTIADPMLDGCPLIGCSVGFTKLCGYELHEIVGRNCRFLVEPVPKEKQDKAMRDRAREFCEAVRDARHHSIRLPPLEPWMPSAVAGESFCFQMNARKDGSHFLNMFYMVAVEIDDQAYILGLQTELYKDKKLQDACVMACKLLKANMQEVDKILASNFWYTAPMRRQEVDPNEVTVFDGDQTRLGA
jgi:hypothetical protein